MKKNGFSIVEVMMALGLLAVVVLVVMNFTTPRMQSKKMEQNASCLDVAQSLVTHINTWDNSLDVRSFLPDTANAIAPPLAAASASDPLCRAAGDISCDTEPVFALDAEGKVQRVSPQLNLRNAYNWARNVYHNQNPQACTTGLLFNETNWADLDKLLLGRFDRKPDLVSVNVKIQDPEQPDCAVLELPDRPDAKKKMLVSFDVVIRLGQETHNCQAEATVRNAYEASPASFGAPMNGSAVVIRNGAGEVIPQDLPLVNRCTCRRPYSVGMVCPEMNTVSLEVETSEPGVQFLCQMYNPIAGMYDCGGIQLPAQGGGLATAVSSFKQPPMTGQFANSCQGPGRAAMNCQTSAEFTWSNLAAPMTSNDVVQFDFLGIDTSGNTTSSSTANDLAFVIRKPECPDPLTYCPSEIIPDNCGGVCPVGQMPPVCPSPASFCPGTPLFDQCGRPCPPGNMAPGSGCPSPAAINCGQAPPVDSCGNACPMTAPTCPNPAGVCAGVSIGTNQCGQSCGVGSHTPICPPAHTYCGNLQLGCGVICSGGTVPGCVASNPTTCPGAPGCHVDPPCNNTCPTTNCAPVTVCAGTPEETVCPATDGGQSDWVVNTCNTEPARSFCGGPPVQPTRECRRSCRWMSPIVWTPPGSGAWCFEYFSLLPTYTDFPHGVTLDRTFTSCVFPNIPGRACHGNWSVTCNNGTVEYDAATWSCTPGQLE